MQQVVGNKTEQSDTVILTLLLLLQWKNVQKLMNIHLNLHCLCVSPVVVSNGRDSSSDNSSLSKDVHGEWIQEDRS